MVAVFFVEMCKCPFVCMVSILTKNHHLEGCVYSISFFLKKVRSLKIFPWKISWYWFYLHIDFIFSNIYYWLDDESWMKVIVNECFVVNEQMFHGEWKCTRSLSCVQLLVNSRYSFVKPHSVNFEYTELSTVSLWLQVVHTIKALKTTFLCAFVLFMLAWT